MTQHLTCELRNALAEHQALFSRPTRPSLDEVLQVNDHIGAVRLDVNAAIRKLGLWPRNRSHIGNVEALAILTAAQRGGKA